MTVKEVMQKIIEEGDAEYGTQWLLFSRHS